MLQDQIKTNWKLIVFFILCLQFASLGQRISELQNEITGIWTQNTSEKISLENNPIEIKFNNSINQKLYYF